MDFKEKRHTETIYLPTKRWLLSRNPETKKQILAWYSREKNILAKRKFRSVARKFEAQVAEQDRDTKKIARRSRAKDFKVSSWRLTERDYLVYRRLLDRRYQKLKEAHNAKIKAKRKAEAT